MFPIVLFIEDIDRVIPTINFTIPAKNETIAKCLDGDHW